MRESFAWNDPKTLKTQSYVCGFCGHKVASDRGWSASVFYPQIRSRGDVMWLAICLNCDLPSLIDDKGRAQPPPPWGEDVAFLPQTVDRLYGQARAAMQHGAPAGSAMIGRKLLMHVAVHQGADENLTFKEYVRFLEQQGIVTAAMSGWVDEIRELGNDASHELLDVSRDEVEALLTFVAMLLRIVYEYPERGRRSVAARQAKEAEK